MSAVISGSAPQFHCELNRSDIGQLVRVEARLHTLRDACCKYYSGLVDAERPPITKDIDPLHGRRDGVQHLLENERHVCI